MPKKTGIWRQEWDRCSRCGFLHPIGMLVPQNGLTVCTDSHGCFDNIDVELRPRIIGEILATDEESVSEKADNFAATAGDIEL